MKKSKKEQKAPVELDAKELTLEEKRKLQEIASKAKTAFERSNFGYAVELYQSVLLNDPNNENASRMFFPSTLALRQTKGSSPATDVLSFLENIPFYIKFLIQKSKRDEKKIMFILIDIIKKEPKNFIMLKLLGSTASNLQFQNIAIHAYKAFLNLKSKDLQGLKALSKIYMDLDDRDSARNIFKKILKIAPFDNDANRGLKDIAAKVTIEKSNWDDNEDFRSKIKDEDDAKLSEIEAHLSKTDKEIMMIIDKNEELLKKEPHNLGALRALSEEYQKIGKMRESLEAFKKLSEMQPGDAELARSVVLLEHKILKDEEASEQVLLKTIVEGYKDLCDQFPTNYKLLFEYGDHLLEAEKIDEAIAQFQRSITSPNYKSQSINKLGICFERKNILDLAIEQFQKGIESCGNDMSSLKKDITYNLASTLEKAGKHDFAIEHYKAIYQVDISYKDISKKIEDFYKRDKGSTSTTT
ncbi:MAG: hypothetical protein KAI43_06250 [Candidatus Aureabacteria bacterium]|nr:hypothetical protein [Candidatus Auribacterota bacterium]